MSTQQPVHFSHAFSLDAMRSLEVHVPEISFRPLAIENWSSIEMSADFWAKEEENADERRTSESRDLRQGQRAYSRHL
jgi:hypothetical protein